MKRHSFIGSSLSGATVVASASLFTIRPNLKESKISLAEWSLRQTFNKRVMDQVDFADISRDADDPSRRKSEENPVAMLGERTSQIGPATSEDGVHFKIHPTPTLYPDVARFSVPFSREMYWGASFISLVWSDNLADWYPERDDRGELRATVEPRKYNSHPTECGPHAIRTDEGIVLLYNGKNSDGDDATNELPKGMHSVGKVLSRSEAYLLKPTLPLEITGQYESDTTIAEGMIYNKSKWFLYYGTADSFVEVHIRIAH